MARRSAYRTGHLLLRDFLSHLGTWIALASTVAILSTAATALPLAFESLQRAEAAHALDALTGSDRLLLSTTEGGPAKTPGETDFTLFLGGLDGLAARSGTELAGALGPADFVSSSSRLPAGGSDDGELSVFVRLTVAPSFADQVLLVDGALPAPFSTVDGPIDIALSEESAAAVDWSVGESRMVGTEPPIELRLSALIAPAEATADYWALIPTALRGLRAESYHEGARMRIVTVDAFIDPESAWALKLERALPMTTTVGFGLDISGIPGSGLAPLEDQLRRFTASTYSIGNRHTSDVAWEFRFSSASADTLHQAHDRTATTAALTAVAVSGPVGIAIALLWLFAALFLGRRRRAFALLVSRGAGEVRLRLAVGLEALAVATVAAGIGAGVVLALFGRLPSPVALVPAAVVALAAAVLLALVVTPQRLRLERGDLSARRRSPLRLAAEAGILATTALSVVLLLQRGLVATQLGFDPLLAATPLLLCLSTGLLVLRAYPIPLLAVLRGSRSGRGIVAFLGSARAIRSPAAGLAAVLAVIVGLGVSLFSVILLDTVRNGIDDASRSVVGADLRVSGSALSPEDLAGLGALPGVEEAVGVYRYGGQKRVTDDRVETGVIVLISDLRALSRVQADVPGAPLIDGDPTALRDGSIPAVFSAGLARAHPAPRGLAFSGSGLVGTGTPGYTPSFAVGDAWLLVDSAFSEQLGIVSTRPTIALLDLEPGADAAEVSDAVRGILGESFSVLDPATATAHHQSAPVVAWLQLLLLAVAIAMAIACAAACILSLVVAAPATARLVALLRTLGLVGAQSRGIIAWEIAPVAIIGTIAGCAAGTLLPLLVLPGLDLRPFTGGTTSPPTSVDLAQLAVVAAGFVAAVALTTAIVMMTTRRLRAAAALRDPVEG